jgi:L-galactonate dehydratase
MGLTELTSHLSTIDYIAISGRKSLLENADSHRENLRYPSRIVDPHYVMPLDHGSSTGYTVQALEKYTYPDGSLWRSDVGREIMNAPTWGEL